MASSPTELVPRFFTAPDGVRLAWRETGEGAPVLLLHGLFSDAHTNWIKFGHASRIASAGFRVVMPDLRAHGSSGRPHDPAAYPPDILVDDALALIGRLGIAGCALGGYSLGGRTVARMLIRGVTTPRAVIAGMGLPGLLHTGGRAAHFRKVLTGLGTFERGSPEWLAEAFLRTTGGDPDALQPLLDSFVDSTEAEVRAITSPVLVACGEADDDNGSASALADTLSRGILAIVPGNHMSAVTKPEFGRAIAAFLSSPDPPNAGMTD